MSFRRRFLATLAAVAMPLPAAAQSGTRVARVAWLGWTGGPGAQAAAEPFAAFRDGMAAAGWREGRNLALAYQSGEQSSSAELARTLASDADVLVCEGPMVFGARRAVPATTSILFSINGDPVEAGLVASLARPGGNLTGITALSAELSAKRVEYLKQCVPAVSRIAAVANQAHPGVKVEFDATTEVARRLGIALQWLPIRTVDDLPAALAAARQGRAEAIVAVPDNLINDQAKAIAAFCESLRIPAISGWGQFAEAGNVLSYGPNRHAFFRRLGEYADRILKGARAGDLPVERPTTFELVVNAAAARRAGVVVPQDLLLRAERVIR